MGENKVKFRFYCYKVPRIHFGFFFCIDSSLEEREIYLMFCFGHYDFCIGKIGGK